jgi:hypothetical protein
MDIEHRQMDYDHNLQKKDYEIVQLKKALNEERVNS